MTQVTQRELRELEDRLDLADMARAKAESEGALPYKEARKEVAFDVPAVKTKVTTQDILDAVRDSRAGRR